MKIYQVIVGFAVLLGMAQLHHIEAGNATEKLMLRGTAIDAGSHAFSPNGTKVVTKSTGDLNLVYIWNRSGKLLETLNNGQPIDKIVWGPDSKSLIIYTETPKGYSSGGHDYPIVTLWNLSQ